MQIGQGTRGSASTDGRGGSARRYPPPTGVADLEAGAEVVAVGSLATPHSPHWAPRIAEGRFFIPQTLQTQFLSARSSPPPFGVLEEEGAGSPRRRVTLGLLLRKPAQYSVWRMRERESAVEERWGRRVSR